MSTTLRTSRTRLDGAGESRDVGQNTRPDTETDGVAGLNPRELRQHRSATGLDSGSSPQLCLQNIKDKNLNSPWTAILIKSRSLFVGTFFIERNFSSMAHMIPGLLERFKIMPL